MMQTLSGQRRRASPTICSPSPSSSRRSDSTRSYSDAVTAATASATLAAVATSWPSISRIACIVTATLSSSSTMRMRSRAIARRPSDRERDAERGALADAAAHLQAAAVALDDPVRDPQPEPRALLTLRGEERLEDVRHVLLRDAAAAVTDLDLDRVGAQEARARVAVDRGGDGDRAALPHRLGAVQDEIEDDLLQLVGGGHDGWQRGVEILREAHVPVAEPLRDERLGLLDERVHVGRLHRRRRPVEAEHLPEDARHPLGLFPRDVEELEVRVVLRDLVDEQVQRVLDRLERVVDLVRDRRGEPAGRGELLRVEERLLETPALELAQAPDVLHHGDGRDGHTGVVADLGRCDGHLEILLGLGIDQRELTGAAGARLEPQLSDERRELRAVPEGELGSASGRDAGAGRGRRLAEDALRGGIHGDDLVLVVDDDDRVRDAAQDEIEAVAFEADLLVGRVEPLHVARELLGHLPEIGDVLQHRDHAALPDAVVGGRDRDDLEHEVAPLDRVDEGELARTRTAGALLKIPGRERRREEEVVHGHCSLTAGAVVDTRAEELLRDLVLEHDLVLLVRDHDGIRDRVDHPPEPFLLDGCGLAGAAQVDVPGALQLGAGAARERDERVHVGLRERLRTREEDDANAVRLAVDRGDDELLEAELDEDLPRVGAEPLVRRRRHDVLRKPGPQGGHQGIAPIGERHLEGVDEGRRQVQPEGASEQLPLALDERDQGPVRAEGAGHVLEDGRERGRHLRRAAAGRGPLEELEERAHVLPAAMTAPAPVGSGSPAGTRPAEGLTTHRTRSRRCPARARSSAWRRPPRRSGGTCRSMPRRRAL